MKNKKQVEKQLDIIAQNLQRVLNLPRTSEMQKEADYYMGYKDALQWVLKE